MGAKKQKQPENKRMLFCCTAGRSGSMYLAELLDSAENTAAFHEPRPRMIGKYVKLINKKTYDQTYNKRKKKARALIKHLPKIKEKIYAETNQMFLKTFFDVLIDAFPYTEVIILRREPASTLKSYIELNYFTSLNKDWHKWFPSPNAATAAIPCIAEDKDLDHIDKAIAYLVDMEARIQRFIRDYPDIPVHETRLEDLNSYRAVENLFQEMNLAPTNKTKEVIGKKKNLKMDHKKNIKKNITQEYCQKRIEKYIKKAEQQNIAIPPVFKRFS